jgi:probable HAF family extracellular repeat protein
MRKLLLLPLLFATVLSACERLTEPQLTIPDGQVLSSQLQFGETGKIVVGLFPGSHYGWLTAINDHGQVAGIAVMPTIPQTFIGFVWAGGEFTEIGEGFFPNAINNNGQVAGVGPGSGGFLWHDGALTYLPLQAKDINDFGQVVGSANVRAVLWQDGEVQDLGTSGWAESINNNGQVVGWWNNQSFIWQGGVLTWLPGLGDPPHSRAYAVNNSLQVTGWPAMFWENGVMQSLPTVPGAWRTEPEGINDAGQVVGFVIYPDQFRDAVVWQGGAAYALPREHRPGFAIQIAEAYAINNHGHVAGRSGARAVIWDLGSILPPPPPPSNTPVGSNVQVWPSHSDTGDSGPVSMVFSTVTEAGETAYSTGSFGDGSGYGVPGGYHLGYPAVYFSLGTTASFSGSISISIDYSGAAFGNTGLVRLLQSDGQGGWIDITSGHNSAGQTITGGVAENYPWVFVVVELNVAPEVISVTLPVDPIAVNSPASITATFTDGNPADSHNATIDWVVAQLAGTVDPTARTVSGSYSYATAGVYPIEVEVSDGDLSGSRSSLLDVPGYIVVYDPSAGFATGSGSIQSPREACPVFCAGAVGEASFGFQARYRRGAHVPDGNAQFRFQAGGLEFESVSYDWLVIAGSRARFKGVGTVNGAGDYGFMILAIDGSGSGGGGVNQFRIKIWDRAAGDEVIYDNQWGADETSDAATALIRGNIMVQAR